MLAMRQDMNIIVRHKPAGIIKSRVSRGTPGKVVAFFITPTSENSDQYTVVIASKCPNQTDFLWTETGSLRSGKTSMRP